MVSYDVCVVGAGMIGSAAAKYCQLLINKDQSVVLIGPEEPKKQDYWRTEIFASYYDEGRMTGHLDSDEIWCYLSKESIKRYRDIENESKINFYNENGYLNLFFNNDGKFEMFRDVLVAQNVNYEAFSNADQLKQKFPYLNISNDMCGLYESTKAGTLNPRRLVEAQQCLATEKGLTIIRDIVTNIQHQSSLNRFQITTSTNGTVHAAKVLLCTGAFLWHQQLLPTDVCLDVKPNLVTAGLIPLNENDLGKLSSMPSVSLMSRVKGPSATNPFGEAFSFTAPVKYPDGVWYVKIVLRGDLLKKDNYSTKEVTEWYRNGFAKIPNLKDNLAILVKNFLSGITIEDADRIIVYTCSLMETPNYRPYIDKVCDNLYIVTGCNGNAARSSDEFGRIAAKLVVSDVWDCPFDWNECKCLYQQKK